MRTQNWRTWLWQYALPIVLLSFPPALPGLFYTEAEVDAGDADGAMLLAYYVAQPVLALLIGVLMRPARLWIAPAVAIVLSWIVIILAEGIGNVEVEQLGALAFLVALPQVVLIWLGKSFRNWVERTARSLLRRKPHTPTMC
jgi:hypothetical protein